MRPTVRREKELHYERVERWKTDKERGEEK